MFTISVNAETQKEMATKLSTLAATFSTETLTSTKTAKVKTKPVQEVEETFGDDEDVETDDDASDNVDEISDQTMIEAFTKYATKKSREKAVLVLKKIGFKKPALIPQNMRAEVLEKITV